MESSVPNSFIPRDATSAQKPRQYRESGGMGDLFMLLSVVLFVASVGLAIAVFLYGGLLQSQIASKQKQIDTAKSDFNYALIQQIGRLADRMHASQAILGTHIAPTTFFSALNQSTLTTVSFKSLVLTADDLQHLTIKMSGVARSVNSVALQAELFSKNGVITNPIFGNVDRQSDGVHFSVSANINPAAINYGQLLSSQGQPAGSTSPTPTAADSQPAPEASPFGSGDQEITQ